jgi:tetratricopeptide (TPR) repeat protein
MKTPGRFLILILVLACLLIPGIALAQSSATISSAPADTSGTPPQDAAAFISEAKAAVAGENWTSALLITTRGTAWYPENADLLCLHGYIYRKIGQYQKSVDTVSLAIPLDPKPVRYANRGYGYLALGNYSAALADADSGIALNESYPTNHGVKALALQGLGKNAEALTAIDKAIALEPGSAHYWHVKGRILAAGGDCTGASAALEQSLALDAGYVLPWPGFGSARENLAALNTSCAATASPPATAKSPLGWIAVAGLAGAVIATGMRK